MRLLVTHIRGLVGAFDAPPAFLAGADMRDFPVLEDAWLAVEDGQFVDFGPMSEFPGISDWRGVEVVDASGCYVLPSWCDSHCHPVFAEDRTGEFLDRLQGLTYAEIAARGGGILNSARALAALDVEELVRRAKERVEAAIRSGTGAMEMKSGYGLSVEAELRSMRAIWRLQEELPIPVTTTLLACHAVPEGYDAAGWTREAVDRLLPAVLAEGRVDAVDVFCEAGYFGLEETEEVLRAASRLKLRAKLHVNQFTAFGGVALCVKYGAASVDHLEILGEGDVEALQAGLATGSPTFPVALPGCSHFLGIPYTDGRRLIDAGLPLVLATDYNPGSAPCIHMPVAVALAVLKMRLHPLEALCAATLNGAAAMGISDRAGCIAPGRRADFILTVPMQGLEALGYRFGDSPVQQAYLAGRSVPSAHGTHR